MRKIVFSFLIVMAVVSLSAQLRQPAWGQLKAPQIAKWTKKLDPTRLVNTASGGNFFQTGDMLDLHHCPDPVPEVFLYDGQRATVLGEYGGLGLFVKDHLWKDEGNWGYRKMDDPKALTDRYVQLGEKLLELSRSAFSAGVYTQTTDVEGETNGLLTYGRAVVKMDVQRVSDINQKLCNALNK